MFRIVMLFTIAALSLLGPDRQARAETFHTCKGFIDSLPAVLSTQGTWCLRKDLTTAMTSGNAIEIATNNVTIDCNGFKIGGLAGGTGTGARAIRALDKLNATVRHCNIRGFQFGIELLGANASGGHLIEDNALDSNTIVGVYVRGVGSTIRNNTVIDTGGSTGSDVIFWNTAGIRVQQGVDVINNTINGVAPAGTNASAYGIYTTFNGDGSVGGNRVRGLAPTGTGAPRGIYNIGSGRGVTRDNDVQGPGPGVAGGVGIYCTSNAATAGSNMVAGFATGISGCLTSSNVVNPN